MLDTLLPIVIFSALALAMIGAVRRIRLWRQGRPAPVALLGGLAAMPRREQEVVQRRADVADVKAAGG